MINSLTGNSCNSCSGRAAFDPHEIGGSNSSSVKNTDKNNPVNDMKMPVDVYIPSEAAESIIKDGSSKEPLDTSAEDKGRDNENSRDKSIEKADEEKAPDGKDLDAQDKKEIERLKTRDNEVRAHEHAHVAAGGSLVRRGASFEYKRGPDGKMYANGGEVSIDTSSVPDDPQATINKAQTIKRAALAPAEPSSTDRKVAAEASRMEAQARAELADKRLEDAGLSENEESSESKDSSIDNVEESGGNVEESSDNAVKSSVNAGKSDVIAEDRAEMSESLDKSRTFSDKEADQFMNKYRYWGKTEYAKISSGNLIDIPA